ncbi:MAG: hypothetical protein LBP19_03350 [Treponema sp.]|jgi:cell shape-determining protein MreC|nr:hypothetical protein [Treponema sp.]
MDVTAIIAILATLVGAPTIVFSFIYKIIKNTQDLKKLQYQKEILALEIEKQHAQLEVLEAENKRYDKIIQEQ